MLEPSYCSIEWTYDYRNIIILKHKKDFLADFYSILETLFGCIDQLINQLQHHGFQNIDVEVILDIKTIFRF